MRWIITIMSNAGYTRNKGRYKASIFLGVAIVTVGFLLGFWIMYYTSPRLSLGTIPLQVAVKGSERLEWDIEEATSEKVYYDLNLTANYIFTVRLRFYSGGEEVGFLRFANSSSIVEKGRVILLAPPDKVVVDLICEDCIVKGAASFRYFSYDGALLALLDMVMIFLCMVGLGFFLYGIYNYFLSLWAEEKRGKRELKL